MNSIKIVALFTLLVASAHSAPTETDTTTSPSVSTSEVSSDIPSSTSSTGEAEISSSSPPGSQTYLNQVSSSFTCFNKSVGYYGDVEHDCKIYHFCLLGDYNGETVYQRISYLCLNQTMFDQQALDCVEKSNMSAPCTESPNFYDQSNKILRDAIVGNRVHQGAETTTPQSS